MILVYTCDYCKKIIKLPFKASDRGALLMKNKRTATCIFCHRKIYLNLNKVFAKSDFLSSFAYGIAFLLGIIIVACLILMHPAIYIQKSDGFQFYVLILMFFVPFLFAKVYIDNTLKQIKNFNRFYV